VKVSCKHAYLKLPCGIPKADKMIDNNKSAPAGKASSHALACKNVAHVPERHPLPNSRYRNTHQIKPQTKSRL